jgi:hypothetical protein
VVSAFKAIQLADLRPGDLLRLRHHGQDAAALG